MLLFASGPSPGPRWRPRFALADSVSATEPVRLTPSEAARRFAAARVARLGTAGTDQQPHLVPVTFALVGDRVVIAVDGKPKRSTELRRLRNIRQNPAVCLLADHYDEDWTRLWWVRADGRATIEAADPEPYLTALRAKYPQYQHVPLGGPLILIETTRWTGWSYR